MNEELKKMMREILLESYGVDIDEAKCHYSTQNYAFIFPEHPYMIRVSMTPKKTRKEILSELMWVDDLKQFKQTICEPSVSLKGNLLEERRGEEAFIGNILQYPDGQIRAHLRGGNKHTSTPCTQPC